jgi:hypothetical protein
MKSAAMIIDKTKTAAAKGFPLKKSPPVRIHGNTGQKVFFYMKI